MSHATIDSPTNVAKPQFTPRDRCQQRVSLSAQYGAVPWACPEYVSVELELEHGITTQALGDLVNVLAGVPAAARPADTASEPEPRAGLR